MALIDDIEDFLVKHEISPTALGDRALGDRHFVRQLRLGRDVRRRTEHKVRRYMEEVERELHASSNAAPQHATSTGQSAETSGADQLRGAA